MTTYRFRVKYEHDPRSLWRDIVVGADRTLNQFQSVLNSAVGLDQVHLWFFGTDQDYWDSGVQYKRPVRSSSHLAGYSGVAKSTTLARRRSDR
ncbi:plasmid pRiA4b ORF-3 family protein [Haloquadratum walsbyi]|uniref:plasmid pRiA4b ORF-3 family protein n=1 Tax=Haloquadratum walsbyi TaxID=293091 RepID=UPI001E594529|nr:plasmid pRiA4b ORF-3 family protein [Haloquadratum walsbyi]